MKIGLFSPELAGIGPLEAQFADAKRLGAEQLQYSFETSIYPRRDDFMPEYFLEGEVDRIAEASKRYGVEVVAINAEFNLIEPDDEMLRESLRRFEMIAEACGRIGCKIIAIGSGAVRPEDYFHLYEGTTTEESWKKLISVTKEMVKISEKYKVYVSVEPEPSQVVHTMKRARRYLDDVGSQWLKITIDCGNLFPAVVPAGINENEMRCKIQEAFDLIGKDIALAHGKDLQAGECVRFAPPGRGIVDYELFFKLLKEVGYSNGLVLHYLKCKDDFDFCIPYIKEKLERAGL